jgi:hypothetical protein
MYPYDGFDAVEVWNGQWTSDRPWNADNEAALAEWGRSLGADVQRCRWRPAMGTSDTHLEDQMGTPHTVVLADELSCDAAGVVSFHTDAGRCTESRWPVAVQRRSSGAQAPRNPRSYASKYDMQTGTWPP